MEVVSGSGKWKYCEVVVDGPNEPPYVPTHVTYVTCTRHPEGRESGIIAKMEVEARWKWKHDGSGSTMEVVSGSGKWKYCEVVVDGPNEPP